MATAPIYDTDHPHHRELSPRGRGPPIEAARRAMKDRDSTWLPEDYAREIADRAG